MINSQTAQHDDEPSMPWQRAQSQGEVASQAGHAPAAGDPDGQSRHRGSGAQHGRQHDAGHLGGRQVLALALDGDVLRLGGAHQPGRIDRADDHIVGLPILRMRRHSQRKFPGR